DHPDVVYKTVTQKFKSVADSIVEMHQKGRPVLVGTISIEKSEYLSELLKQRGIPHNVLNAKYHEQEARIVAQAGRYGAVTIATNMAGRGTDIILGGNFEGMVMDALAKQGVTDLAEASEEAVMAAREEALKVFNEEREKVVALGGLHIIGTERHESRRIDNQLRGRAARQGDPGSTHFFLSLEDDLMRLFGGDRISKLMDRMKVEEDMAIEAGMVTRAIANAQRKVEIYHFNIRKQVLEYDDVMNQQRAIIYRDRRKVLEGENLRPLAMKMIEKYVTDTVESFIHPQTHRDDWDIEGVRAALAGNIPLLAHVTKEELDALGYDEIKRHLADAARTAYESKESIMDPEMLRQIERYLLLRIIDTKWIDHLHDMDVLREGIGLRAYGQKDPLIEYKREAYDAFMSLMASIQHDFVAQIFHVQVVYNAPEPTMPRISNVHTSDEGEEEQDSTVMLDEGPGRNEPCPCGSGKKFKKCCGSK
ncbi:MAG: SEC-C metal-binding domain-containing protein, partial [Bacteroidota bacterium]